MCVCFGGRCGVMMTMEVERKSRGHEFVEILQSTFFVLIKIARILYEQIFLITNLPQPKIRGNVSLGTRCSPVLYHDT